LSQTRPLDTGGRARTALRQTTAASWRALDSMFGGPARTRVILLFAGVLALNSADTATVGSAATQLRAGLHISNADIGLLVAVTAGVVAVFSVPFGIVIDRSNRIAILTTTVALWGVVMVASAAVSSFGELLILRAVLGALTAASGPGVASLVGDYFPGAERGKIYGYVLAGELLGAGAGFVVTGDAADISWRLAFVLLAIPTVPLAWLLGHLAEPARGGASRLEPGADRIVGRREAMARRARAERAPIVPLSGAAGVGEMPGRPATAPSAARESGAGPPPDGPTDAQEIARRRRIAPDPRLVLGVDPRRMGIFTTARYVLAVRTNLVLILSGACGYFFLTGVETFGLEFAKGQYHVSQIAASLLMLVVGGGAIAGVMIGGRLGDNLVTRGYLNGRIIVPAIAALVTTVLFLPALVTHSVFTALPYITLAAFALTAQNPPIDAARLDIMPPLLWGRAEGIRSFLRTAAQALAPLAFGGLSDLIGGSAGLKWTFAVMLLPFLASGVILLRALRTYPVDVATAAASAEASAGVAAATSVSSKTTWRRRDTTSA
jgi:MFS family permease